MGVARPDRTTTTFDQERQRRLLNLVLASLALPTLPASLILLVMAAVDTAPPSLAGAALILQSTFAAAYLLGRSGRLRLASYLPGPVIFVLMAAVSYSIGIGHVTYIGYAMASLVTAVLTGIPGGVAIAVLSTLTHTGVALLQRTEHLPSVLDVEATILPDSFALGFGLLVIAIVMGTYRKQVQDALRRERAAILGIETRRETLEQEVHEHTADLERRLVQIQTAAEVSRAISTKLELQTLLPEVVELVRERFNLYYVGVFLLNDQRDYAVLQAGTGEAGQRMVQAGHQLRVGGASMIGWSVANGKARIAMDIGQDAVRFSNPNLPLTRSELALPLHSGQEVIGAMTVQSEDAGAFDEGDITALQGIADSLATALENARLFDRLQSSLEEVETLHKQYLAHAWSDLPHHGGNLRFRYQPEHEETIGDGSKVEVPLRLRDQTIGRIFLDAPREELDEEQRALAEAVAAQAAQALENARLLEETQRRATQERISSTISGKVWSSGDVETILRTALQELGSALGASGGQIRLRLAQGNTLEAKEEVPS